jgi:hypothetical protein
MPTDFILLHVLHDVFGMNMKCVHLESSVSVRMSILVSFLHIRHFIKMIPLLNKVHLQGNYVTIKGKRFKILCWLLQSAAGTRLVSPCLFVSLTSYLSISLQEHSYLHLVFPLLRISFCVSNSSLAFDSSAYIFNFNDCLFFHSGLHYSCSLF